MTRKPTARKARKWKMWALVGMVGDGNGPRPYYLSLERSRAVMKSCGVDEIIEVEVRELRRKK